MSFCEQWIELDYNPYLLFDENGKILSLNNEAQYLLGYVDAIALFELATSYASSNRGFKTSFLNLEYGRFKFFAVMVGYEDENEIGLRLYQSPAFHYSKPSIKGDLVNVYTLIDLCISSNSIGKNTEYIKELDPTLPDIRLQAESFIKLLNKVYSFHDQAQRVVTKLFFRVGEYIRTEDKKYTLFSIEIKSDVQNCSKSSEVRTMAEAMNIFIDCKDDTTIMNIPLITD